MVQPGPEAEGLSEALGSGEHLEHLRLPEGPRSLICAAGVVMALNVAFSQAPVNTQEDSRTEFTK